MNYTELPSTEVAPSNATDSAPESNGRYQDYAEFKVALFLNTYSLVFLCPIGVLLNSAAIFTIVKLKPFNTSSLYVLLLAIFDSLTLIAKLTYLQLTKNEVDIGDFGCKFLSFIGSFLDQFSIWILVLLTIERFVAVWLPLKVSCWFTMFRARLAVMITALCLFLINSNLLYVIGIQTLPPPHGKVCGPYQEHEFYLNKVWYWIESCLSAILPCLILADLNILIIYRMRKAMKKQKQMISGTGNQTNTSKHSHKANLAVMLVTVSSSFVILVLPLAIFNAFRGTWNYRSSPLETARYVLTGEVTHFLADCNHGLNFVLYFVTSRRFRRMFYALTRCKPPIYDGHTGSTYLRSSTAVTNTYYLHTSVRGNGGI